MFQIVSALQIKLWLMFENVSATLNQLWCKYKNWILLKFTWNMCNFPWVFGRPSILRDSEFALGYGTVDHVMSVKIQQS